MRNNTNEIQPCQPFLSVLPDEIKWKILELLEQTNFNRAAQVNREARDLVRTIRWRSFQRRLDSSPFWRYLPALTADVPQAYEDTFRVVVHQALGEGAVVSQCWIERSASLSSFVTAWFEQFQIEAESSYLGLRFLRVRDILFFYNQYCGNGVRYFSHKVAL